MSADAEPVMLGQVERPWLFYENTTISMCATMSICQCETEKLTSKVVADPGWGWLFRYFLN